MTAVTFQEAIDAFEAGDRETLLPKIGAAVRAGTADPRFWHLHGLVLRDLGRREDALPSLRKAAELAPESAKIAHALARTLCEAGLPSIDAFGNALRLAPGDTDVIAGMTSAFVSDGEPQTAIQGLERILARSPHWTAGHSLLSRLRWAQGDRDNFTANFAAATVQMPQNVELWRQWIIALAHAERWDEMLDVIAKGRAAVGENVIFAVNEAIVHAERGETEIADRLFEPLADMDDGSVHVRRVRHYLRSGRPAEADRILSDWLKRPDAFMFWPYASIAWRMMDDPRWDWLEGDERFVGVYDIADRLPPLDELAATLRKLHTLSGQPLEQSLRGGTQTDGELFSRIDPVLIALREAVRRTVAEHAAQLPEHDGAHPLLSPPREPIRFSGSWSVWLRERGFHANHVHPAGWNSSALYNVLPPDNGEKGYGIKTLGASSSSTLDVGLPPFRTVEPKPGRLVLFPSYTWHGTRPFGKGERITVAFDVAVPGGS
jgi:Flp pilus assembly protein TadD